MKATSKELSHVNTRQAAALIRALHAQGESLEAITDQLNTNCFETAKGEAFDVERVRWILGNMEEITDAI